MGYTRLIVFTCLIAVVFSISTSTSINNPVSQLESDLVVALIDAVTNLEGGREEEQHLAAASEIRELQPDSPEINDIRFHAQLCHTVNCRDSLNNWDCKECLQVLPDGEVLNYFKTAPNDIVGQIIRSKARKTIFVQIRGATSTTNRILFLDGRLVPYPPVTGGFVNSGCFQGFSEINHTMITTISDQVQLHPDYRIHVIGHSFGGCIASLAGLELLQRVQKLNSTKLSVYTLGKTRVGNKAFVDFHDRTGIDHKRMVAKADSIPHQFLLRDGYLHEGVEYWMYDDKQHTKKCGGKESRSCSNSVVKRTIADHLLYYGTFEGCVGQNLS
ncbi:Alpha/Beta hydrolase protein [Umbelopsis sp. AD052]|nr:Alpha/Beta hydrolase protein [Umbelopsis sp. AD052]